MGLSNKVIKKLNELYFGHFECFQNVDENKQHDWYKQMYKSLHKTKKKEGEIWVFKVVFGIRNVLLARKYIALLCF